MIFETTPEFSQASVAYPNYLDWRRESRSFTDMGAYRGDDFNFTGSGEPEQVSGEYVSASLFPTLGVHLRFALEDQLGPRHVHGL